MDEIDVMACYARHDECPVCGGSTERDAVEDLGDCVRRHAGLVVCRKDGDDDDCDWSVDVPKEVLEAERAWEDDHYEREAAYLRSLD